jgi:hypothetical protein
MNLDLRVKFTRIHRKAYKFFLNFIGNTGDTVSRSLFRLFQSSVYCILFVFLINCLSILWGEGGFGEYGDFMGGVLNPLLSFIMIMGILITIILQQSELKEARKEFKRSADALAEQSQSLALQNFENTFFQMLRLHNDIVKDMFEGDADTGNKGFSGRDCFGVYHQKFDSIYYKYMKDSDKEDELELIEINYKVFFFNYQSSIGHYFRNLYTIIKLVDAKTIPFVDKKQYTNIVRAQLSSYELSLLFYNCLSSIGRDKFKPLIEKYELLANMDFDLLSSPIGQISLYDDIAYGDSNTLTKYKK